MRLNPASQRAEPRFRPARTGLREIKHDGYRLIVQREGKRVRLWTRNGYDWSDRLPLVTEAARRIKADHFVIDGEAVPLCVDGVSDFAGLHSRKHDHEVQFYAFDMLVGDAADLRSHRLPPTYLRKSALPACSVIALMALSSTTSSAEKLGRTSSRPRVRWA